MAKSVNSGKISICVDEVMQEEEITEKVYMNENMMLMFTQSALKEAFGCAVDFQDGSQLIIAADDMIIYADYGENFIIKGNSEVSISNDLVINEGILYIPLEILIKGFGYRYSWDGESLTAHITTDNPDISAIPYYITDTDSGKFTYTKNQENLGACWAFAALSTVEYSLLPDEVRDLSEDNMIYNNSFGVEPGSFGDYLMALSYLAAWQGPVAEEDDLYNDGIHPESADAVLHVQEAQFAQPRDFDEIKRFVYNYGAAESAVYISLSPEGDVSSEYYNSTAFAYCYSGDETVNHEIVIIGWDDSFPASNFVNADSDGAFICLNSWGSDFADEGIFYVSYCDTSIGTYALAYTGIEDPDNYDNIYQYDFCGWNGNIGYNSDTAYFANVFCAQKDEFLSALSFYATEPDTEYAVYVISDFEDTEDLNTDGEIYAYGTLENAGYYTISTDKPVSLSEGESFAVIVRITSPGSAHPVAVETNPGDERSSAVSFKGCVSYISDNGENWTRTQTQKSRCNVCLKAFTDNR